MTKPVRIQLSRRKGFNLQAVSIATNGLPAVKVTRPGLYGNPYKIDPDIEGSRAHSVRMFRDLMARCPDRASKMAKALRGKNLACWCPSGLACHADVLLEIANSQPPGEKT